MKDVTSQCTFSPAPGTSLMTNQNLVITYGSYTIEQPLYVYTKDEFNSPVKISNTITDCSNMFNGCTVLNQPVTIGNNVTDCSNMFNGCLNFDQSISIGTNVINCSNMFNGCTNFNQSIVISENMTDCNYMFANCVSYSQPMTFDNSILNCDHMFSGCNHLQIVNINNQIANTNYMFENCNNLRTLNFMQSTPYECKNIIGSRDNSVQLNIIVEDYESLLNMNYLMGDTEIIWSQGTGCVYNTDYNINVYGKTFRGISIVQTPQQYYPVGSNLDLGLIRVDAVYG